jgi:hypothetical protein
MTLMERVPDRPMLPTTAMSTVTTMSTLVRTVNCASAIS